MQAGRQAGKQAGKQAPLKPRISGKSATVPLAARSGMLGCGSLGWARAGDCFLAKNPCQPGSATCTSGARFSSSREGQRCSKSASLYRRRSHIAARGRELALRAARGREQAGAACGS